MIKKHMKKLISFFISFFFINIVISQNTLSQKLNHLPIYSLPKMQNENADWLLGKVDHISSVFKSENGKDLIITNGLISREFRVQPYFACFSFRNLMMPKEMIRAIQPEAQIEIDGAHYNIGGVKAHFEYAYMKYDWL
jgi:galactitol-specific phosphotransferase system IIB component